MNLVEARPTAWPTSAAVSWCFITMARTIHPRLHLSSSMRASAFVLCAHPLDANPHISSGGYRGLRVGTSDWSER